MSMKCKTLTIKTLLMATSKKNQCTRVSNSAPLTTITIAIFKGNLTQRGFKVSMMTAKRTTRNVDGCLRIWCRWGAWIPTAVSMQVKDSSDQTNKTNKLSTTSQLKIVSFTVQNQKEILSRWFFKQRKSYWKKKNHQRKAKRIHKLIELKSSKI